MNEFQRRLLDIVEYNTPIGVYADHDREIACIDNYAYSIDFNRPAGQGISAALGPQQFDVVMDSDSDFVLTYISGAAILEFITFQTKLQWNAALRVQITDRSTGRTYFNQPTILGLVAGGNGFPFLLSSPRVIKPRTTLRINVAAANADPNLRANSFFLTLHGAKIYYK